MVFNTKLWRVLGNKRFSLAFRLQPDESPEKKCI